MSHLDNGTTKKPGTVEAARNSQNIHRHCQGFFLVSMSVFFFQKSGRKFKRGSLVRFILSEEVLC